jgi:hypothetical protein
MRIAGAKGGRGRGAMPVAPWLEILGFSLAPPAQQWNTTAKHELAPT